MVLFDRLTRLPYPNPSSVKLSSVLAKSLLAYIFIIYIYIVERLLYNIISQYYNLPVACCPSCVPQHARFELKTS